jgi:hypothetical protein
MAPLNTLLQLLRVAAYRYLLFSCGSQRFLTVAVGCTWYLNCTVAEWDATICSLVRVDAGAEPMIASRTGEQCAADPKIYEQPVATSQRHHSPGSLPVSAAPTRSQYAKLQTRAE